MIFTPDVFGILDFPVKEGELRPFYLWMWWHFTYMLAKAEA